MDEFEVIRRYFQRDDKFTNDLVSVDSGDDCAVLKLPLGEELCVSTDTLIEGVHFPIQASGRVAAARAIGANLSDLAAMGATPHSYTVALTIPEVNDDWLSGFASVLAIASQDHHMPLVGGNLAKGPLSITVTIMGRVAAGEALLRSGACVDDDIYVSGCLGDAAGGLKVVVENLEDTAARYATLRSRYQSPLARISLGQSLQGLASAGIDVSDGFLADLSHVLKSSGVGACVELDKLPVSSGLTNLLGRDGALAAAATGGDDYELCFTAPKSMRQNIEKLADDPMLTRVGHVTADTALRVNNAQGLAMSDYATDASLKGYTHFK
jgi:thiamine-monophosphate kinase